VVAAAQGIADAELKKDRRLRRIAQVLQFYGLLATELPAQGALPVVGWHCGGACAGATAGVP
jgi:hypothetical protein